VVSAYFWRFWRYLFCAVIGVVRPGWRRALPVMQALERYSDRSFFAPTGGDPRFYDNLDALRREVKRLRRGGEVTPVVLPHDYPPGAREDVRRDIATVRRPR
jgi:hypothetical protein